MKELLYNHPDFLIPAIQNHIQCSCGKVHLKIKCYDKSFKTAYLSASIPFIKL